MGINIHTDNPDERVQQLIQQIDGGHGREVVSRWDTAIKGLSEEQANQIRQALLWNDTFDPQEILEGSPESEKVFPE